MGNMSLSPTISSLEHVKMSISKSSLITEVKKKGL